MYEQKNVRPRWQKSVFLLGILALLGCAEYAFLSRIVRKKSAQLELTVDVPCTGTAQVFVDFGKGFSEKRSLHLPVWHGTNVLHYPTGTRNAKAVRFDPPACATEFAVRRIRATSSLSRGEWPKETLGKHVVAHHDANVTGRKAGVSVQVRGDDPYVAWEAPKAKTRAKGVPISTFLRWFAATAALCTAVFFLVTEARLRSRITSALDAIADFVSHPDFVRFRRSSVLLVVGTWLVFILLAALRIHNSSVEAWNTYLPQEDTKSVVFGGPLGIRSDEWKEVPAALAEVEPSWGTLLHASSWGYFVNSEVGLSWSRNFTNLYLFLGGFLMAMLFTRGAFAISLIAAVWCVLSAYAQWWSGFAVLTDTALVLLGVTYGLFGTAHRHALVGAVALCLGVLGISVSLYPPWLVPFSQWGVLLAFAIAMTPGNRERLRANRNLKLVAAAAGFLVIGFGFVHMWQVTGKNIMTLAETVYPGRRVSGSGEVAPVWLFSGFYDVFYAEWQFPLPLGNVCEASSFILAFPAASVMAASRLLRRKTVPPLAIATLAHIVVLLFWMVGDLPEWVGAWTLLDRVPGCRAISALGTESILLTTSLLAAGRDDPTFEGRVRPVFVLIGLGIAAVLLHEHGEKLAALAPAFYTPKVLLVGALLTLTIVAGSLAESRVLMALGVLLSVGPNALINPINRGFAPVLKKDIVAFAKRVKRKDPNAKWLVYDSAIESKLFAAAGVDVFNNRGLPDAAEMRILDPKSKHKDIWNRYSAIRPAWEVPLNQTPEFNSPQLDVWGLGISPRSPMLDQIGVRYVAFRRPPSWEALEILRPLAEHPVNGFWLYERGTQFSPSERLVEGRKEVTDGCGTLAANEVQAEGSFIAPPKATVVDVLIVEQDSVHRCWFELSDVAEDQAPRRVHLACPRTVAEAEPRVEILLGKDQHLPLTTASACPVN